MKVFHDRTEIYYLFIFLSMIIDFKSFVFDFIWTVFRSNLNLNLLGLFYFLVIVLLKFKMTFRMRNTTKKNVLRLYENKNIL